MKIIDDKFNLLSEFTDNIDKNLPRKKTESFIEPPKKDLDIFFQTVYELLTGNIEAVEKLADSVSYEFFSIK